MLDIIQIHTSQSYTLKLTKTIAPDLQIRAEHDGKQVKCKIIPQGVTITSQVQKGTAVKEASRHHLIEHSLPLLGQRNV